MLSATPPSRCQCSMFSGGRDGCHLAEHLRFVEEGVGRSIRLVE